jgi:hypothetical protein
MISCSWQNELNSFGKYSPSWSDLRRLIILSNWFFNFVFIDFEIDKIHISYFKQVHIDINIMKYLVPSFVNIPFLSKKSMWTSSNDSKLVASVVLLNYLDCTYILYLDIFLAKVNFRIKLIYTLGHIQTIPIGFNFLSIRDRMIQTKSSTS